MLYFWPNARSGNSSLINNNLYIVGIYDQSPDDLFNVDLACYLADIGTPPAGIVYKHSKPLLNPPTPIVDPDHDGRLRIHVADFNAPETVSRLQSLQPDLLVYAGGRDILRQPLLDVARHGCIGGHYGRLPEVRGMATVEWSVMLGLAPTVAIQRINSGIDTGNIIMQAKVPLVAGDTYTSIRDRSYFLTKVMLALSAYGILHNNQKGTPQNIDAGRQYFRLHPAVQAHADLLLEKLLSNLKPQS